jgi:hypothetical protein
VAVVINSSSSLSTFDITLLTNSLILKPTNASAAGSIINGTGAAITVLSKCIGGTGTGCAPTDTVNTLHYTVSSSNTAQGPATGLLFTATYNIVGVSQSSVNSPIGFQTGCGSSSVSNGICITILSGSTTPVPETAQIAKFTNQAYFDLQTAASVPSLTVPEGSSDTTLLLNVTSINGFSGTVTIASSVSPAGPTVTVIPTSVKVNASFPSSPLFGCCQINATVSSSVSPGNYTITFTGTSGTLPTNTLNLPLIVPKPDFTITASPSTLTFNVSRSRVNSTITLKSLFNFAGKVNLTLAVTPGMQASLLKDRFNVTKGGTNSTTLSLTPAQGGVFSVNITATSLQQTPHQVTIQITVLDFVLFVQPAPLVLPQGSSASEQVSFTSVNLTPYNVTVTIVKTYVTQATGAGLEGPSTGISVTCFPLKLNLTNSGTGESTSLSNCKVIGNEAGNYTVTVIAASGTVTHATAFPVQVLGPDFSFVPSPSIETLSVGTSGTISIALARQLGFTSNVTLDYAFPGTQPSHPSVSINLLHVPLNSTFPTGTAIVTVTSGPNALTGIYSLQLSGFSQTYQIRHTVTVAIVVTTTSSPHDLAVYSVSANPTSTTVGSTIQIAINVQNLGKVNETSTVVAIVGDLSVGQQNVTIAPGANVTVTLKWNTNGFSPGAYMVGGKVLAVPGETILSNNLLRSPTPVTLTAANSSIFQSSYFQTALVVGLLAIIAIVTILFLQTRRKIAESAESSPKTSTGP